jgi:NTE family protein
MEDTIQKGERESGEETQPENERIVEEFLRQNQDQAELNPPEDEENGSTKVIQWVEQAGDDPASHTGEVPELEAEISGGDEPAPIPDSQVGDAAESMLDTLPTEVTEPADEPQVSDEDATLSEYPASDSPAGLGDMPVEITDADIEFPAGEDAGFLVDTLEDNTSEVSADNPTQQETIVVSESQIDEQSIYSDQPAEDGDSLDVSVDPSVDEPEIAQPDPDIETFTPDADVQPGEASVPGWETPVYEPAASIQVLEPAEPEPPATKIALILSGGGAKGAFQVGAEKYAREVRGYHWDIIAGVSVGAMNGAMLSMHRYARLMEIWDHISDNQVYTGGFNLISLVRVALGSKSFYSNAPLQKLMQSEFEAGRIIDDLHVGAVSLHTGEYIQFTRQSLELAKAILASASIPVVWPPVNVSSECTAMVDGGVRNITPVGDVLDLEPDEIVIINCGPERPALAPDADANVLSIGLRALDLMQDEIFINDMKTFLRINALVQEAEEQGCFLHHPKTGKLLKYYPCQVIEPDVELSDTLDFSQKSIQASLRCGVRRAREVLGRP